MYGRLALAVGIVVSAIVRPETGVAQNLSALPPVPHEAPSAWPAPMETTTTSPPMPAAAAGYAPVGYSQPVAGNPYHPGGAAATYGGGAPGYAAMPTAPGSILTTGPMHYGTAAGPVGQPPMVHTDLYEPTPPDELIDPSYESHAALGQPPAAIGQAPDPWIRPWRLTVGGSVDTVIDQFGEVFVSPSARQFVPLGTEDTRVGGGFFVHFDTELTEFLTMTSAVDAVFFGEPPSIGVPDGAHVVWSFLFNVDPQLENIFYGVGIDFYATPSLDPFDDGQFDTLVVPQLRGGVGISTAIGDLIVRGGGRLWRDYDESFPNIGAGNVVAVGFTTKHIEGGIETQIGQLEMGFFGGHRSDATNRPYFAADWRLPLPVGNHVPYLLGDLYIDDEKNVGFHFGFAYDFNELPLGGLRRVLKPMSVTRANRFLFRNVVPRPADF